MATAIQQLSIWQDLERELPPGLLEVREFLLVMSRFDGELVHELQKERGHGRDDLSVLAMWNLLAVSLYLRRCRFSDLLAELRRNSDLARLLGFEEIGPNQFLTPSKSALSRFHVKLTSECYLAKVEAILRRTVEALKAECPQFGKHVAVDASDVRTHAQPPRRVRDEHGNEHEKPSSDPEASWSVKTKITEKGTKETKSTFGYKFYATSDQTIPGVCAVEVTTGSASDVHMAMPMLDAATETLGKDHIETAAMDKGFDSTENIQGAFEKGIAAIVPVRDVPEDLEKQPPADREELLAPGGNLTHDRYTGEVFCYAAAGNDGAVERRQMKYAGFEWGRREHKFRCPLGAAAASTCKAFHSCAAGSCGSQGRQVPVPMETDYRRFAPVYPRSKRWKRLYNGRSASERVNSYVKEVLGLEHHCLRGKNAVKLRVLLASITLNVRTLTSLEKKKALDAAA
jgi:hypothetical protein